MKLNQYLAEGQFLQQLLQDTAVELNQYLAAGQFLQQLLQDTAVVVDISGICTVTLTVEVEGAEEPCCKVALEILRLARLT